MDESACPLKDSVGEKGYLSASLPTPDVFSSPKPMKPHRKYFSFFGFSGGTNFETNTMRRRRRLKPIKTKNISTSNPKKIKKHSENQIDLRIKTLQANREKADNRNAEEIQFWCKERNINNVNIWEDCRVVCQRYNVTRKKKCLKVDTESIPGLSFLSWI